MDRLKALFIFKAVVDRGSFIGAANSLDLSCAMVTRTVQDLEAQLGVRLLHRTTRRIDLTAAGQEVLVRVPGLLQSYEELEGVGRMSTSEPTGVVRLSAPTWVGRYWLGPALADFRRLFPRVQLVLDLSGAPGNIGSSSDVSLCLLEELSPSQISRPLADLEMGLYAAPNYLARVGHPEQPAGLADHDCLVSGTGHGDVRWSFARASGERQAVKVRPALQANHAEVLADAALHGAGIVMLPELVARRAVTQGRLQRLLSDWLLAPMSICITYASRRNQPVAARRLIEHLVSVFENGVDRGGARLPSMAAAETTRLLTGVAPPAAARQTQLCVRES